MAETRLRANAVVRRSTAWSCRSKRLEGSAPTSYSSRKVKESLAQIGSSWPREQFTVVYSADLHDATSGMVAMQLSDAGFTDVHVLHGGFEAWQKAQGPMEPK